MAIHDEAAKNIFVVFENEYRNRISEPEKAGARDRAPAGIEGGRMLEAVGVVIKGQVPHTGNRPAIREAMSDNSRLAGGQEGGSNGGLSQEAVDHLLDLLSPRPTHVTPQLTRPGFSKQAEFNTLVLNKLEEARKDPSVLEAVIELIKERNSFLVLADKNPKLLDALDTAKAIEGASGTRMMIAQTLTQVQSQSNDRKRRALSPSSSAGQPFRYRAPAFPQAAGQSGLALRELMSKVATVDPELTPVLTRSLQDAKAPATMRVYKGSMKQLRVFARKKGIDPSCPSSLLIFALRRIHEGRSLSSLKILHSAYSHFCDPLPPFFANLLSSLFDCTRRSHPVTHHPKVPSSHIYTIVRFASLHPTEFHIVRCALGAALAYGALLRVSELISLRWSDLSWSEGLLRVSIRKAKNDQFSEGRETFISIGEESETLSLFDSYRSRVPLSVWVFPSISHPLSHITSDSFRKDLYSLCSRVGITKFTPHQLRGGGAMESIRRGASVDKVQRRGRWRSIAGLAPYLADTVETQGGSLPLP
ncbi:hypothetical protein PRIPAC_92594 [Pristionchus pacificus]|uniref:Tyr recombinase domain-containing protein n=1 Tax=Pristionchus pacificus TaxID=54126 RepID=A0A2A6BBI1_PRIPA|nr:hypothetical protein PRIPAC_92594 [Pristionchus pacificus]|eukprot:PDM63214.1 hypothetical protein PRIPAC_50429 [Pristionchus pacificus]